MQAIREIVTRDIFKNYEIPKEFGDEFEMILVPTKDLTKESEPKNGYFEITDSEGVEHKIPNWTDEEFKEFGLRSFFKDEDTVPAEEV